MDTIDIRDSKRTGNALKQEILHMVEQTQLLLVRPYPDKIKMTKRQFLDLSSDPQMVTPRDTDGQPLEEDTERIYVTRINAMEVEVI